MKIIIAGAGDVGSHLAKMLSNEYHDLTIIDNDETRLSHVSDMADVVTVFVKTIAEVENIDYIKLAEGMGIDAVINKKLITASRIFRFTLSNRVQSIKCLNGSDAEILEFIVNPNSSITKDKIRNLGFPKDAIIGSVIRGNHSFIALGDTEIKPYDRVVVFALPTTLKKVNKFFA